MRRILAGLCLTAALSGPLLRQAEAAGDHVRALATCLDSGGAVTTPDGGVGDDSGETTLTAGGRLDGISVWGFRYDPPSRIVGLPSAFALPSARPDPGSSRRRQEQATWLPAGAGRRHAWLQRLVI